MTLFHILRILYLGYYCEKFGWGSRGGGEERWEKNRITPPSYNI
jgi:hypothetical protein